MKLVEWTDENGFKRGSLLREQDPEVLKESGVPVGPPNLDFLDWEGLKRDLHNQLYQRGLFTWDDVVAKQNGVTSAILSAMRKRVVTLYRVGGNNEPKL